MVVGGLQRNWPRHGAGSVVAEALDDALDGDAKNHHDFEPDDGDPYDVEDFFFVECGEAAMKGRHCPCRHGVLEERDKTVEACSMHVERPETPACQAIDK